jgi:hypothetical protein
LETPTAVLDPATGIETPASIFACHKCYDTFEHRDMTLTRLYIRSLLSNMFYEAIQAKHLTMGHDFKRVPGQVLFIMVMDACHASIERDFEGARKKALVDLTLEAFPSENISDFVTSALSRRLKFS